MLCALVLVGSLALAGTALGGPMVRVDAGEARLVDEHGVRALDRRSGTIEMLGQTAWVEAGAMAEIELSWRGFASVTIHGPAAFQLARAPGLALERARLVELEVRRGTLVFELGGVGWLALAPGALRVRSLPDGVFELLNRGGSALGLQRTEEKPLKIAAGECVRVRSHSARDG